MPISAGLAVLVSLAACGKEPDTVIYIVGPSGGSSGSNGSNAGNGAGGADAAGGDDGDGGEGGMRPSGTGASAGAMSSAGGASSGTGGEATGGSAGGGTASGGSASGGSASGGSASGGSAGSAPCVFFTRRCVDNKVEECSDFFEEWRVFDDCDGDSFCDPVTFTCRETACQATAPSCDNNRATVCDNSGSMYAPGGSDCGSLACVDGACSEPIFRETFETGFGAFDFNDVDYRVQLTQPGANGTGQAVTLDALSDGDTNNDAIWAALFILPKPRAISFWVMATGSLTGTSTARVAFSSTPEAEDDLMRLDLHQGFIRLDARNGQFRELFDLAEYVLDTWYHVEYRNIDWVDREFDVYVDGVMRRTGLDLDSSAGIRHIAINGSDNLRLRFDEIELR